MLSSRRIIKVDEQSDNGVRNYQLGEVRFQGNRPQESRESKMQKEVEAIKAKAYQEGFKSGKRLGFDEGIKLGRERMLELEEIFKSILLRFTDISKTIEEELERDMLLLVTKVAAKVIKQEISQNEKVIVSVLKDALAACYNKEGLKVILNPEDLQYINRFRSEFVGQIAGINNVELIEDSTIVRGGCVVETSYGNIDARIDAQLQAVVDEVKSWIKK